MNMTTAKSENEPIAVTPLACPCTPSNRLIALVQSTNHIILPMIAIHCSMATSLPMIRIVSIEIPQYITRDPNIPN